MKKSAQRAALMRLVERERPKVEALPKSLRILSRRSFFLRFYGFILMVGSASYWAKVAGMPGPLVLGLYLVLLGGCSTGFYHLIRGSRMAPEFQDAAQSLLEGDVASASRAFDSIAARTSNWWPSWRAIALIMQGSAANFREERGTARSYYLHALQSGWLSQSASARLGEAAVAGLASMDALSGNTACAHDWIDAVGPGTAENPRYWLPARATLEAREGKYNKAIDTVGQAMLLERSMMGAEIRPLRLIRAFSEERVAGDEYREEAPNVADPSKSLQDIPQGSLDYMAVDWPELGEFLERRALRKADSSAPTSFASQDSEP